MKKITLFLAVVALLVWSCNQPAGDSGKPLAWTDNATMYEVNIRQYTPEGTFKAFEQHLPRLQKLGVKILWFMPIHPIGVKNRKGALGSYYSISDYKAVNPEYGTFGDFKSLVDKAHKMGFKVLIDCVANHSSWDNVWMENHKDWYTQDSLGNVISPVPDWSDVADLNYNNPNMRAAMLDALKFWVTEAGIDGYRCDYAGGVPTGFWEQARVSLDSIKPVFMLAENEDQLDLLNKAFDCNYSWTFHHTMNEIYSGKKQVADISNYFQKIDTTYPGGKYPLEFTSNHDENSWNGTEYERLGDAVKTFATLAFTVPGMPLIYSGQEAGLKKRLSFFGKDTINWGTDPSMGDFYAKLVLLKKNNPALWNGLAGGKIEFLQTSQPEKLLAFKRTKGSNTVLVLMNLSKDKLSGNVTFPQKGRYTEFFSGKKEDLTGDQTFDMNPWEYHVFIKK
jgi:glycosidase